MAFFACAARGAVPLLLFSAGLFFLIRLRGFFLFHPIRTVRYVAGRGERRGALSALAVALGGTLGVGNITGVASALFVGGPGALLWMWISALFSMGLHYAEVVLALDTAAPPGLPRYLGNGFGKTLFALSLLCLSLSLGGALQSAAAAEAAKISLSLSPALSGALLALAVVFSTVGGFARIGAVSRRVIPVVTLLFSFSCLGVIVAFRNNLPGVLAAIFREGLSFRAAAGGGIGTLFLRASVGFRRGLLSNEGGCGTASLPHAAGTGDPAKHGVYGIAEVGVDTLLLCTLSGLAILCAKFTGDGVAPLLAAFGTVYGNGAKHLLAAAIFLFAFATALAYGYYGKTALAALSGGEGRLFPCLFAVFLFLGGFFSRGLLFFLSDLFLGILAVLNLAALLKRADRIVLLSAPLLGKREITPRDARPIRKPGSSKEVDRRCR